MRLLNFVAFFYWDQFETINFVSRNTFNDANVSLLSRQSTNVFRYLTMWEWSFSTNFTIFHKIFGPNKTTRAIYIYIYVTKIIFAEKINIAND